MGEGPVIIVGGGIVGLSVACHLAEAGADEVCVLESAEALATGSTARSVGGIRVQQDHPLLEEWARDSLTVYQGFEARFGRPVDLRQDGYLFLATTELEAESMRRRAAAQQGRGVAVELWSSADVERRMPAVNVADVLCATWCADDGFLDPYGAAMGFAARARQLGVEIRTRTPVQALVRDDAGGVGVRLSGGDVRWGRVVLAAGVASLPLASRLGVSIAARPCKRQVFVLDPVEGFRGHSPLVLTSNPPFYVRADGATLLASCMETAETGLDRRVDWSAQETLVARAVQRIPELKRSAVRRAWAGIRMLTEDGMPLLGPVPGSPDLFVATGFNGKGVMLAPAVGKLVALWLLERTAPEGVDLVDPGRFFLDSGASGTDHAV